MEIQVIELIIGLSMAVVTFLSLWVRKLTDEIASVKSVSIRMAEDQNREHDSIKDKIDDLSTILITEVRSIVSQHAQHDRNNVELQKDIDSVLYELRRSPKLAREDKL